MIYKNSGTCSRQIEFNVVDRKVTGVIFTSGCNGNLKGIGSIVEGMDIDEVIARTKGITCGAKSTSCPDQLAKALEQYKAQQN